MTTFSDFTSKQDACYQNIGFRVTYPLASSHEGTANLLASRTVFSWKGLVLISQHVVLHHKPEAKVEDLQELFEVGFRYGKRVNRIPLLRGMQFGYLIIPCIVVEFASSDLIDYVNKPPHKHWSLFEFPVVHELSTNRTYFYQQTSLWGAFYFSDARAIVESTIGTGFSSEIHPPIAHP